MSRFRFNPDLARNSCVSQPNRYKSPPHRLNQRSLQRKPPAHRRHSHVERVTGIEPALSAWEAEVLPLNYTRKGAVRKRVRKRVRNSSVKYAPSYLRD